MKRVSSKFVAHLGAVDELIQIDIECDGVIFGITHPQKVHRVQTARASACLLTVALFEHYLKSLCTAYVDHINTSRRQAPWESLPNKLRETHIFDSLSLNKKLKYPGESQIAFENRMLSEALIISQSIASPLSPGKYRILSHGFTQTNSNPDPDTVSQMMNKIGCGKIFSNQTLVTKLQKFDGSLNKDEAIRLKLEDLVRRRHKVAHGDLAAIQNLSRKDIVDGKDFFVVLAKGLEEVARASVLGL